MRAVRTIDRKAVGTRPTRRLGRSIKIRVRRRFGQCVLLGQNDTARAVVGGFWMLTHIDQKAASNPQSDLSWAAKPRSTVKQRYLAEHPKIYARAVAFVTEQRASSASHRLPSLCLLGRSWHIRGGRRSSQIDRIRGLDGIEHIPTWFWAPYL